MGVLQQINGASMGFVMAPGVLSQLAELSLKSTKVSIPQHSYWKKIKMLLKNVHLLRFQSKVWRLHFVLFLLLLLLLLLLFVLSVTHEDVRSSSQKQVQ